MSELNEADRYLLEQIRGGSSEGWSQFVDRFEGRLLSFARSNARNRSDAEDLVQETLISFLRALPNFRGDAGFETYLFTILRRKIIDAGRGRGVHVCLLQDVLNSRRADDSNASDARMAAPDPTASWYARRDEQREQRKRALAAALREVVDHYKQSGNFRDLQVVEMIFYSQLRNKDIAEIAGTSHNHVALLKHRCLARLQELVGADVPVSDDGPTDDLVSAIWQEQRLSCLKRSTLGAYLLGTLDEPWRQYAAFHLDRLGCSFCRANLDDLRARDAEDRQALRRRIMESTVGFLSRT